MVVDTPAKYDHLIQGKVDNYRFDAIDVTSEANPDVLHLPKYFENTSIDMNFILISNEAEKNTISVSNEHSTVHIHFTNGQNSLHGIPTDYYKYLVRYTHTAIPTTANIDSILQWQMAEMLIIGDHGDIVLSLFQRIDELKHFIALRTLDIDMNDRTYDSINVGTFIEALPSLRDINFSVRNLSDEQIKAFIANNTLSAYWNCRNYGTEIFYRNY